MEAKKSLTLRFSCWTILIPVFMNKPDLLPSFEGSCWSSHGSWSLKKSEEEGADGAPGPAAVHLHWLQLKLGHHLHLLLIHPPPPTSVTCVAPALPHFLHVGLSPSSDLLAAFGPQDSLSFAGVLSLLQLSHHLLEEVQWVLQAPAGPTGITAPVAEGGTNRGAQWDPQVWTQTRSRSVCFSPLLLTICLWGAVDQQAHQDVSRCLPGAAVATLGGQDSRKWPDRVPVGSFSSLVSGLQLCVTDPREEEEEDEDTRK